jgi:hypothetical protein
VSDERDDAPSIPGLPYLNLLVPAATCQVFSDSTIGGILDDSSNTPLFFALLLLFALLIVLPILHFFGVLSFVLQVVRRVVAVARDSSPSVSAAAACVVS